MSSKDILQPYAPDLPQQRAGQARTLLTVGAPGADECGKWYSPEAVRHILADAHAHYEAQVRPRTGLAQADEPNDTQMLDWMIDHGAAVITAENTGDGKCRAVYYRGGGGCPVCGPAADTPRAAIAAAMKDDK